MRRALTGSCHCGNVELRFETGKPDRELPLRACDCSFCRRHGARTLADPAGRLAIQVRNPAKLNRYRFGLRTADYLVCRECGVYLAAVLTAEGRSFATINANVFPPIPADRTAATVSYDGESEADRRARRIANWTPVTAQPD